MSLPVRSARRLAAAALLLLLPNLARAEASREARAVIDRYVEVTGGKSARDAVKSVRVVMTITAFGMTGSNRTWEVRPNRHASDTEIGPFKIKDGYDGKTAWRIDPSGKLVIQDGKDLESAKGDAWFQDDQWTEPGEGGGKVVLLAPVTDTSGTWAVLEVTPPTGRPRTLFFDTKTGLLGRSESKRDQQTIVSTQSDYRDVQGRLIAFRTRSRVVEMPANDITAVVDSIFINEPIDETRFQPPGGATAGASTIRYLKNEGVASLPFEYSGRHVWVMASVNGNEPAHFLYDTGASITVIDSAYAKKIGLVSEGKLQGQGAGAAGSASFASLKSLKVEAKDGDGVEYTEPKVAVLALNDVLAPFFWRDCAGVIGFDFINRFVNEIDFDKKVLVLRDPKTFKPSSKATAVPFTLAGTVPVVKMKIGKNEGEFRVDVGSGSTVDLHTPYVKKWNYESPKEAVEVTGGGFGGMFKSKVARLDKISIGPYAWERPLVGLSGAESGALASEEYAGNIGNRILERFKCTLDYEHRTMYLEPGARYRDPDRFSLTGLQLARYGDTVKVLDVMPDSPAAKATIRQNDHVTSIDGKPILSYTLDTLEDMFEHGKPGDTHMVGIERDGTKREVRIRLKEIL